MGGENPADQWHERVIKVEFEIGIFELITSEAVIIETLNYFNGFRAEVKELAAFAVRRILESDEVETLAQTPLTLLAGLKLYESRLDKGYSLTDCISMTLLRERGIFEVLTHDHHFKQEGFNILL